MTLDTTQYPNDTIVLISVIIGGASYTGSGVLISPDEVLTASHVVYLAGQGYASNIVVTPGYDSGSAPYGSATGSYIHYFPVNDANDQISNIDSQSDFAVIHLSTPFTSNGYMGLLPNFSGGVVNVAGYPTSANGALVLSTQEMVRDANFSLLDGIALGKGSSGGPVWVGGSTNPQVVGIVSSGSTTSGIGYNTLITSAVFNLIEQWVAADDGKTVTPPPPAQGDVSVTVRGTHTQYIIANSAGDLFCQDLVSGRDGTVVRSGVDEIIFTDGVGRFDTTGNAEKVARLYGAAFGRGADLSGLNYWTHQIDSTTLQLNDVAIGFIASGEFRGKYGSLDSQHYVQQLYQNVLNRSGDASGMQYWTSQADAGTSRSAILIAFSDSFENKRNLSPTIGDKDLAEAYRLYQAAIGRAPDETGLGYWTSRLDQGANASQVAQDMAGSTEFTTMFAGLDASAEVNTLYQHVLHRAGDAAGVNYWAGQLQAGASIGSVLAGFADALENRIATASVTHDGWVYIKA